ncbi:MAG: aminotransferase class I/II-fold pyridoxal phosphate-dependent enzyme [Bacteroidota bacterium]
MEKLKSDSYRIPLITPDFGQPAVEDLQWIVENQVPAPNRVITAFERLIGEYAQRHALATQSGTAALHLALASLGIGQDDEVLCSDFTFAATVNAILYTGATPVLLDAEPHSWGMDPELLELALRRKARQGKIPKAVILTHVLGHAAPLGPILELCQKYHVWLIEDAAGGLGSTYQGQPLGSWGDAGVLSFNYNKILSTGGGGALLSSVSTIHERSEYLAHQAKTQKSFYFHKEVGYNYRINGFGAGIGVVTWPQLTERLQAKRTIRQLYREGLAELTDLGWQQAQSDEKPNFWLNGILLPDREMRRQVQSLLNSAGIEVARLWKPMHQQPAYQHLPFMGNGTGDILFERGLALPSDVTLSAPAVEEVCQELKRALTT